MKSKIMAVFLVVLMLVSTVPITITAQDKEHETFLEAKEDALRWLEQQKQEDGCYGDRQLINDTCEALKVLPEQEDSYNDFLDNWYEEEYVGNQDMLARYSVATDDEWLVESFIYDQNDDGGFGLTSQYESDVWDSLLVLEAYIDEYSEEITESGDELINYLCQMQNEDGGWSFNPSSGSDPLLSARTGHDILEYLLVSEGKSKEIEDKIMLLDDFLKENGNLSLEKDNFQEYGYSFLYFNRRGCGEENLPNVQEFLDTQKADGSFYDNVSDTVLAIRLLDIMEEKSRLVLNVSHLDTELSSYVIQSGEEEEITLFGTVSYSVNKNWDLRYKVSILDSDGTTILEQTEQMVTVSPEMKEVKTEPYSFHLKVDEEKELTVLSELYDGENQLAKDRKTIKVKQSQSTEELNVTADITNGKDYQVELSWNDISNQEMLYGYRILRKKDGCEWETRSSWDGEEKVKVLHVYPCSQVKDCLKNWMEQTTNDGEQPAGKGLFDIDAVFIQDYNNKPDAYLLNEEGRYKYDVIFFGSYDGNASQDLTEQSYQATEKFLDSGRGVLFGHDTITRVQYQKHPVFSRFAERLGIYAKDCPNFDYDTLNRNMCTEVNVVNSGFLTSYPWKLSGTLDIATSHNLEQYAGGSLPSTVWMEFTTPYKIIEATGAKIMVICLPIIS